MWKKGKTGWSRGYHPNDPKAFGTSVAQCGVDVAWNSEAYFERFPDVCFLWMLPCWLQVGSLFLFVRLLWPLTNLILRIHLKGHDPPCHCPIAPGDPSRFRGLHGKKSNFSLVESATDRALSAVLDGNAHYYKATPRRWHQITSPWKKCGAVEPQRKGRDRQGPGILEDTTEVAVEISISRLQVFHFVAPGVPQRKNRLFPKMLVLIHIYLGNPRQFLSPSSPLGHGEMFWIRSDWDCICWRVYKKILRGDHIILSMLRKCPKWIIGYFWMDSHGLCCSCLVQHFAYIKL